MSRLEGGCTNINKVIVGENNFMKETNLLYFSYTI